MGRGPTGTECELLRVPQDTFSIVCLIELSEASFDIQAALNNVATLPSIEKCTLRTCCMSLRCSASSPSTRGCSNPEKVDATKRRKVAFITEATLSGASGKSEAIVAGVAARHRGVSSGCRVHQTARNELH